MNALPDGRAIVAVRTNAGPIKGYILDTTDAGAPSLSDLFDIPISGPFNPGLHAEVDVTVLEGNKFVVSWAEAGRTSTPNEPDPKILFQVYDINSGQAVPVSHPTPIYANSAQATGAGQREIVALPGGGFAIATEMVPPNLGVAGVEIRLALFDSTGSRMHADLLVSDPAASGTTHLKELSVLADGRIVVQHSKGIQIVDARNEAVSLTGSNRDDQYIGTSFKDVLGGSNGNDSLDGAAGNDLLSGGDGHDTLTGGAGADNLNGGSGSDFVSFARAKSGVTASLSGGTRGDAAGDVYTGIEGLLGSSSSDIFTGNGSAILMGRGGNDIYHVKTKDSVRETAGGGRDTVYAKASYALRSDAEVEVLTLSGVLSSRSANLTGSNTANAITGHGGRNSLKGQGGHDTLKASSGNDTLSGGTGNDMLQGGTGRDTLKGGSGRDAFVFDTRPSSTHVDRIVDFRSADDSLFLDNAVFAGLGRGSSGGVRFKADMFVEGTGAKDAQDRIVYDRATGSLYHDQDGTGAKAQVKIATLANKAPLSHLDFFVI